MKDKLRELAERWSNRDYSETDHLQGYAQGIRQASNELLAILDAEGDGGAVGWIEGAPDKTYASEWFIAQTTNRERVVLTALPEEYAYDFKTADETYIMRSNIKRWMQFPDSQFIPYTSTHPARSGVVSDEDVKGAMEVYWTALDGKYGPTYNRKIAMRAALEHFQGERHER